MNFQDIMSRPTAESPRTLRSPLKVLIWWAGSEESGARSVGSVSDTAIINLDWHTLFFYILPETEHFILNY